VLAERQQVRVECFYMGPQVLRMRTMAGTVLRMLFEPAMLAQQLPLFGDQPIVLTTEGIIVRHATPPSPRALARGDASAGPRS
jgi:hypothetical protein